MAAEELVERLVRGRRLRHEESRVAPAITDSRAETTAGLNPWSRATSERNQRWKRVSLVSSGWKQRPTT